MQDITDNDRADDVNPGPFVVRLGSGSVSVSECAYENEPLTHVLFQKLNEVHEVGSETGRAGEVVIPDENDLVIHCANTEAAQVVIDAFTKVRDALASEAGDAVS